MSQVRIMPCCPRCGRNHSLLCHATRHAKDGTVNRYLRCQRCDHGLVAVYGADGELLEQRIIHRRGRPYAFAGPRSCGVVRNWLSLFSWGEAVA